MKMRRFAAAVLAAVMTVSMGSTAFAADEPTITVDGFPAEAVIGTAIEFSVTANGKYDGGTVISVFEITKDGAAADFANDFTLEYSTDGSGNEGTWQRIPNGSFGPEDTGYPYTETTSQFRINFKSPGNYEATINVVKFGTNDLIAPTATKTVEIEVADRPTLESDLSALTNVTVGEVKEFSVKASGKYDGGNVISVFEITKDGAAADFANDFTLEYSTDNTGNDGTWQQIPYGEFGPAGGYPFTETESKFRIAFKTAGDYAAEISTVDFASKQPITNVLTVNIKVTDPSVVPPTPTPTPDNDSDRTSYDNREQERWDEVKDEIAEADEGDTIEVNANGLPYLPRNVIRELKGKDITLEIRKNGVTYKVNGLEIGAIEKLWYEFEDLDELLTAEDEAEAEKPEQDFETEKPNPDTGR